MQPLTNFPEFFFFSAKNTISTDFMAKEELQCTSHLLPESDESHEEGWLRERSDKLTLTHTFWTKHKCAVSVSLTPAQWNIMDYSVPHIPLAKQRSDSWEDLSPVQCNSKKVASFVNTQRTVNSKYDVNLVKDSENVVIIPKSDFKPSKAQYSLKQKAIDIIPPFFESLKAAGVIVPCNDSPIRTPLFAVIKSEAKINQQTGALFRICKHIPGHPGS